MHGREVSISKAMDLNYYFPIVYYFVLSLLCESLGVFSPSDFISDILEMVALVVFKFSRDYLTTAEHM